MRIVFLLLLSGIAISISACVDNSIADDPFPESIFSEAKSGIHTDNGTYTQKQSKVIVNQPDYDQELLAYTAAKPASFDFLTGKILLVDMGKRNTGGYSIEVTSIEVNKNDVIAHVNLTKPGQNCLVTDVLTNPYQFVFIPTQKEILITERVTREEC